MGSGNKDYSLGTKLSLYDQLGGQTVISQVVTDFYDRASSHDVTAKWFAKADPVLLQGHLRDYLTVILGGPEQYSGRSMRNAHSKLRIPVEAFEVVRRCFAEAFAASGIAPEIVRKADTRIGSLRAVVVTSTTR